MSFVIKNIHLSIKRSIFPRIRKKIVRKGARPQKSSFVPGNRPGDFFNHLSARISQMCIIIYMFCFKRTHTHTHTHTHTNRKNYISKFIHTILRLFPLKN